VARTYSTRSLSVRLAMNGPHAYLATRDPAAELQIVDANLPLRPELRDVDQDGTITVSCLGDSNTDPSWWPGPTWTQQLARLVRSPGIAFVNKGLGGGTAVDIPDWPYDGPGQLEDTLANDRPDVVV